MRNPLTPPPEARIDIPMADMSMVNFTSGLLEFIMMAAGHTEIRAGKIRDRYYITVGRSLRFDDATQDGVYRKMLFWLLTSKFTLTPEEYAAEAAKVLEMEETEALELIEKLSEGGMTDFGKKVQEYRLERGGKLSAALAEIKAEKGHLPRDVSVLQDELQRRTGYEDLETQEILVAIGDQQRLEALLRT